MTSAVEEYYKLKARLSEPIRADKVDFEPFKRLVQKDRQRLEQRRLTLIAELEDINIKISGLEYVENEVLILMNEME